MFYEDNNFIIGAVIGLVVGMLIMWVIRYFLEPQDLKDTKKRNQELWAENNGLRDQITEGKKREDGLKNDIMEMKRIDTTIEEKEVYLDGLLERIRENLRLNKDIKENTTKIYNEKRAEEDKEAREKKDIEKKEALQNNPKIDENLEDDDLKKRSQELSRKAEEAKKGKPSSGPK